ncbi:MAG: relaxation protein, partial [Lysobacter sp.]
VVAIALAIVATATVLWQMKEEIRRNQIRVELLRAYNQADVKLCGERLCARIDGQGQRQGDYAPVAPR